MAKISNADLSQYPHPSCQKRCKEDQQHEQRDPGKGLVQGSSSQ